MDFTTSPAPRRRAIFRVTAMVGAATALLLGTAAPAAAHASPLPATVANAEDPSDETAPIEMTLGDGGVVTGDALAVSIDIANTSDADIAASTVSVSVGQALGDARAVEAWLDGSADSQLTRLGTFATNALAPDDTQTLNETVSVGDMPPGAYPVVAQFSGGSSPVEERGVAIVAGDDDASVALVMPITGPVSVQGMYSAGALSTMTGDNGLLRAQLDAVRGTDAILAIDPAIPASIRALGDRAPEEAVAWLDELMSLGNERFALQFGDADVTPQIDAGLEEPLAPTHLGAYLDDSAVGTEESPVTLESLTRIGPGTEPEVFWPAPGSADDGTVSALTADRDAHVLVPASSTSDGSARLGDDALAYDDELSDLLLDAARESDPEARENAVDVARTEIWRAASASDGPLLLALDRMGSDALTTDADGATVVDAELEVSAEGLADAVGAALENPAATGASLKDVLGEAEGSVSLVDAEHDPERTAAVTDYLDISPDLEHISTALDNPDLFLGQVRAEAQRVLAVSWVTNPEAWSVRAENFAALNADRAVAIDLQDPQPVQLLSPEAPMPVWIRNDLPYPATVTIVATPDDPRLSIETRTEVVAQPDSSTRVTIPIEARVGSGDVTVHYRLEAKTGEQIGPLRDMEVSVRADWERIGIGILVVLVAGLFGFGIFRQVRRRRREKAAQQEEHSEDGMKEENA